jgi:hypothetical protein
MGVFPRHAIAQASLRGATLDEVRAAVAEGEPAPAKQGRSAFRKNFAFRSEWKGRYYETKTGYADRGSGRGQTCCCDGVCLLFRRVKVRIRYDPDVDATYTSISRTKSSR